MIPGRGMLLASRGGSRGMHQISPRVSTSDAAAAGYLSSLRRASQEDVRREKDNVKEGERNGHLS